MKPYEWRSGLVVVDVEERVSEGQQVHDVLVLSFGNREVVCKFRLDAVLVKPQNLQRDINK